MSLTHRKPRPLTRDSESLRDDRLFILACDDTYAPKQYFDFFRIKRVQIHVVPTQDGSSAAVHVLNRLLQVDHENDDELWMVLDTDHFTSGTHLPSFLQAVSRAKQLGVKVALSKPCFELWLLLHHVEETAVIQLSNAAQVEAALREILGQYNKTNLKREHYPLAAIAKACLRAKRLDAAARGGDIPTDNTTHIYRIWQSIVSKALVSQLPEELRTLVTQLADET